METVNPPRDFGGALNRAIDLLGARMTHPPAGGGGGRGGRGGRGGGGGGGGGHVIKVKRLDAVQLHLRCCWSGRNKKKTPSKRLAGRIRWDREGPKDR